MALRNHFHTTRLKRIVRISVIAYLTLFAGGVALGVLFSRQSAPLAPEEVPLSLWWIALSFILLVVCGAAKIYFRGGTVEPSLREGLLFGAVFLGISFVVDVLLVLARVYYQAGLPLAYYLHPFFLLTALLVLAAAGAVGWHEARVLARVRAVAPSAFSGGAAGKKKRRGKKNRRK